MLLIFTLLKTNKNPDTIKKNVVASWETKNITAHY